MRRRRWWQRIPRAPREGARPVAATRSRPTGAISRRSATFSTAATARRRWTFAGVDRLALRGFLGELERRGLAEAIGGPRALRAPVVLPLAARASRHRHPGDPRRRGRRGSRSGCPATCCRNRSTRLFAHAETLAASGDLDAVRDLAMLELFYSSGLRLSELQQLDLEQLDLARRPGQGAGQGAQGADRSGGHAGRAAALRQLPSASATPLARAAGADREAVFVGRARPAPEPR